MIINSYWHAEGFTPSLTTRIALPLTYDEADYNSLLTLTRSGPGPHVTPSGFLGNGYNSRYAQTSSLPSWITTIGDLGLQATVKALVTAGHGAIGNGSGDFVAGVTPNSSINVGFGLKLLSDASGLPVLYASVQDTGGGTAQALARNCWNYCGRFPEMTLGGFSCTPQACAFYDSDSIIVTAHFQDTVSKCYRIRTSDGAIISSFTFPSPYVHISSVSKREDGTWWFSGNSTLLQVDLDASLSAGTASILLTYGMPGGGSIQWARLGASSTEYLVRAIYSTGATPYLHLIPPAVIINGNTYADSDRYKRFLCSQRIQGITYHSGKLYTANNIVTGDGSPSGKIQRIDLSSQADSLADGGTLLAENTIYGPSAMVEELAFHPVTGEIWIMTEGFASAGDLEGWSSIWRGDALNTPVFNTVTMNYDHSDGATTIYLDNQLWGTQSRTISTAHTAFAVGGYASAVAGATAGFFTGTVKNIVLQDTPITSNGYHTAIAGTYYEPNSLTVINATLTNPGGESTTTGWTNETGTLANRAANPSPRTGSSYFSGGSNAATKARQRLLLTTATGLTTTQIDAGGLWARVYWWQAAFGGTDNDTCAMGIRMLNGTPTQISEDIHTKLEVIPELTWVQRSYAVAVPSGARNIDVLYDATRASGTNLDGYIDDIELVFYRQ